MCQCQPHVCKGWYFSFFACRLHILLHVYSLPRLFCYQSFIIHALLCLYCCLRMLILYTNRLRTGQMQQYILLRSLGLGNCQLRSKLQERSKHLQREAMLKLFRMVWIRNHMSCWQRFLGHPWLA